MKALRSSLRLAGCGLFAAAFFGCGSTPEAGPPLDSEYALLARSAARAYTAGNRDYAARLYRRALERAWLTDNPGSVTNASANLALCLAEEGAFDEALKLVDEALVESERLGGPSPALRLIEAGVALKAGDLARASAALDALEAGEGEAVPDQIEEAKMLRVRILLESGAPPGPAWNEVEVPEPDSPLRAEYCALAARTAAAAGQWAAAAGYWDERAELQRRGRDYAGMAATLTRSGEAWLRADDPERASQRYYRAGRSFAAAGRGREALRAAAAALAAAEEAGSGEDRLRTAALAVKIAGSLTQENDTNQQGVQE